MTLEVARKPRVESIGELGGVHILVILEISRDLVYFIEQSFVVSFMLGQLVVVVLTHEPLFQREMRRNVLEQFAEEDPRSEPVIIFRKLIMKTIDQRDEFLVLMVYGGDSNAELIFPLQQSHDRRSLIETRIHRFPVGNR